MILRHLKGSDWLLFSISVIFIIAQVYLDLQIPGYMNDVTYALQNHEPVDVIAAYGYRMLACAFLSLVASMCTGYLIARASSSFGTTLRTRMFNKVSGFSPNDISDVSVASLVTRSTNDIKQIQEFVGRAMQIVVKSPIMATWAIMKISEGAWQWTVITSVGVLILISIIICVMWYTMKYFRRMQVLTDSVNKNARESLVGVRVIRAYNADDFQFSKFKKASEDLLDNNLRIFRAMVPMFSATNAISNFLTIAIYWTGALLIASASDTETQMILFSNMIVFSSYAMQVLMAFMMMTDIIRNYPRAAVSSSRIEEVLGKETCIIDGDKDNKDSDADIAVEFRDVGFRYPGLNADVVSNVDMRVRKGETAVIIGTTGCGKTTLAKLILRFFDTSSGKVLVNGMDVKKYRTESLHSLISYVPQTPIIFSGTVRSNVDYGDHEQKRDDEDVWNALRIAKLSDYVEQLAQGLDSVIEHNGSNLSGGQKQRLSIARAVCHQPDIYIFDDSFSALDFRTEKKLRESIKKDLSDQTKIVITQRVSATMDADIVFVMDRGRIIDSGTHQELYSRCKTYRDLVKSQLTGGSP